MCIRSGAASQSATVASLWVGGLLSLSLSLSLHACGSQRRACTHRCRQQCASGVRARQLHAALSAPLPQQHLHCPCARSAVQSQAASPWPGQIWRTQRVQRSILAAWTPPSWRSAPLRSQSLTQAWGQHTHGSRHTQLTGSGTSMPRLSTPYPWQHPHRQQTQKQPDLELRAAPPSVIAHLLRTHTGLLYTSAEPS